MSNLQITYLPIHEIQPSPLNPRKHFDEESIKELAASIKEKGVLQAILVRLPINALAYEIVAGERRYRASMLAGLDTIPSTIMTLTDEEALEIMITENLQRKDIHPMEEAAGFFQLIRIKNMDVKEIAARVGKSPRFVAERLKLNDLIAPLQESFFNGHLLVSGALILSQLKGEDQQVIYKEKLDGAGAKYVYQPGEWDLRRYRHNLKDAPFNTMDPHLLKGKPSCQVCPFNSGAAMLFTDMSDPICNDSSCYRQKCDRAFDISLKEAQEDPSVVLITDEYSTSAETDKLIKRIPEVLKYAQYDEISEPEMPDREEYDVDDYDSVKELEDDFQGDMERYNKKMREFNSKVDSGGYTRALKVGGDEKGHYTWVKLKKQTPSSAGGKASTIGDLSTDSVDDLKNEIQRIKDREKRALELDGNKVWEEVKKKFDPMENTRDFTDSTLTQIELTAAAYAIFNKLDYSTKDEFRDRYETPAATSWRNRRGKPKNKVPLAEEEQTIESYFAQITQHGVNELLRVFFLDTLPPAYVNHGIDGDAAVMMKVAEAYWPEMVSTIVSNQKEVAEKRAARVEKKIADLEAKLIAAKKTAAASKRATTKASKPEKDAEVKVFKGDKATTTIIGV